MKPELRTVQGSYKIQRRDDSGERPKIVGYFNVFDSLSEPIWDYYQEEIKPGAFKNSLKGEYRDDIKALFDHSSAMVLGSTRAKTASFKEDKSGLYGEVDPPDTTFANDLIVSLERGDIDSASFGFFYKKTMWREADKDSKYDVLEVHDLDLVEASVVTFPAFQATDIGIRSYLPKDMKLEERRVICRAFNRLEHRSELPFDLEDKSALMQYRSILFEVLPEDRQLILKREVSEAVSVRNPDVWKQYVDTSRLSMID